MTARKGGRRPGKPDTRAEILAAARSEFAGAGFDATTVRAVASAAGVDPALVHHYFGSKRDLFLAVIEPPADPVEVLAPVRELEPEAMGEALVRAFLGVWDGPGGDRARTLLRSALSDPETVGLLREFVSGQVIGPVLRAARVPESELPLRGALIASQLMGLAWTRHVIGLHPIDQVPAAQLVGLVGPTLQRYITDPL